MKKLLLISFLFGGFVFTGYSQTNSTSKNELTKDEKAALKAKQEADLFEAYKESGLTDAQIASCNEVMTEAGKKNSDLRKKEDMSEDEKTTAKKVINDEKNAKLKVIMGEVAFKKFNGIRKSQKVAAKSQQQ